MTIQIEIAVPSLRANVKMQVTRDIKKNPMHTAAKVKTLFYIATLTSLTFCAPAQTPMPRSQSMGTRSKITRLTPQGESLETMRKLKKSRLTYPD